MIERHGFGRHWSLGLEDILGGFRNWRVSHFIGIGEIRRRYSRSRLGQFWVTLSTLIMVVTLGVIWSELWKQPVSKLLPYIGSSLITWQFISGIIGEAPSVIANAGHMYLNQGMSFSTTIFAHVYRHLIIFAHNVPVIFGIFFFFWTPVTPVALLAVPGLFPRPRDLDLDVLSPRYPLFALSRPDAGGRERPFHSFLHHACTLACGSDFRRPCLHRFCKSVCFHARAHSRSLARHIPEASAWITVSALAFVGSFFSLWFIGKYRNRIIYWI